MFGTQSLINYTLVAWLPELMRFNGISGGQISIVLAMYSAAGMPVSLLLPRFLVNSHASKPDRNVDRGWTVDAVGGRFDVLAVVHATCLLVLFVNHYWCNDGFLLHYGANDFST